MPSVVRAERAEVESAYENAFANQKSRWNFDRRDEGDWCDVCLTRFG